MKIYDVSDEKFKKYGRIIENLPLDDLFEEMERTPIPSSVVYEPSIAELEATKAAKILQDEIFGELEIQVGYCNGNNYLLNAVEYHRSSEINIAATDLVLLLGSQQDIEEDFTYPTSKIEAFLVKKGMAVELYATTLHYAPCNAGENGFRDVIVLPKGTNLEFDKQHKAAGEDQLLTAKNKWLIGHEEGGLQEGSFLGLVGENIDIRK